MNTHPATKETGAATAVIGTGELDSYDWTLTVGQPSPVEHIDPCNCYFVQAAMDPAKHTAENSSTQRCRRRVRAAAQAGNTVNVGHDCGTRVLDGTEISVHMQAEIKLRAERYFQQSDVALASLGLAKDATASDVNSKLVALQTGGTELAGHHTWLRDNHTQVLVLRDRVEKWISYDGEHARIKGMLDNTSADVEGAKGGEGGGAGGAQGAEGGEVVHIEDRCITLDWYYLKIPERRENAEDTRNMNMPFMSEVRGHAPRALHIVDPPGHTGYLTSAAARSPPHAAGPHNKEGPHQLQLLVCTHAQRYHARDAGNRLPAEGLSTPPPKSFLPPTPHWTCAC
jgi:hypothetical protein